MIVARDPRAFVYRTNLLYRCCAQLFRYASTYVRSLAREYIGVETQTRAEYSYIYTA